MFTWMEACKANGWTVLPAAGGLEDQEELLMTNLFLIANSVQRHSRPKDK